jgi:serine O-acetyltransferase
MSAIKFYRVERWLYIHHLTVLAKIVRALIFLLFNSFISYTCEIGEGTSFAYKGMGIVIHSNSKIGNNCIIAQQVTIGGRSKIIDVPIIGNNVYIGAGAKVLGNVVIGDEVVIGANAVVLKDVPTGCIVAGVPAKIIRTDIKMKDYV